MSDEAGDLSKAIGAAAAVRAWRRGAITNVELRDMTVGAVTSRHALVSLAVLPEVAVTSVCRTIDEILADPDLVRAAAIAARKGTPWTSATLGVDFEATLALLGQAAAEGQVPPLDP